MSISPVSLNSFHPIVKRPYTPAKGAKAMTIAVGFHCDDMVVIAADRQFTSPGFNKYHEKKFIVKDAGAFVLTFVFAGDPGTFAEAHQKIIGFLDATTETMTTDLIQETVEGVLTSMGWKDRFLENQLFLLIGISEFLEPTKLLVFNGKSLYKAEHGIHIIGCGDTSLIRFLGDNLYRSDMPRKEGLALAAYLIKKATQYVDYCGEPIDVLSIGDLNAKLIPQEEIQDALLKIENQEEFLSTLLIQTPFSSPTEQ